jgi:hypothetical protein
MPNEIYAVLELVDGNQYIQVGSKPTERAAKLLRTKLRGDSNRTYTITRFVETTPDLSEDDS